MIAENKDCKIEFDLLFEVANTRFLCDNVCLNDRMWSFLVSNERKDENSNWDWKNVDDRVFLKLNRKLFQWRDCLFKNFETTKREKIVLFNWWRKSVFDFVFWVVSRVFLERFRNLKAIAWKKLKTFQKRFWNLKETSVDETEDFENVVNKNFALLRMIFLMFLSDRSRRLKALENEKIEKKLKTCLFKLSDDEDFVDKTLMMKWEIAAWESFDS